MDDSTADQRLPHKLEPNQPVSLDVLKSVGVIHFFIDVDDDGAYVWVTNHVINLCYMEIRLYGVVLCCFLWILYCCNRIDIYYIYCKCFRMTVVTILCPAQGMMYYAFSHFCTSHTCTVLSSNKQKLHLAFLKLKFFHVKWRHQPSLKKVPTSFCFKQWMIRIIMWIFYIFGSVKLWFQCVKTLSNVYWCF